MSVMDVKEEDNAKGVSDMANEQNLLPHIIKKGELSREEARKRGSAGGKASAQSRKEMKIFKEAIAERMGYDDFNEIIDNLIKRAKKNDKSIEVLRDTMGQKPIEQQEIKADAELNVNIKVIK